MEQLNEWRLSQRRQAILYLIIILAAFVFLSLVLEVRKTARVTDFSRSRGNDTRVSYHVELDGEIWIRVTKTSYDRLSVGDVCEATKTFWDKTWTLEVCW